MMDQEIEEIKHYWDTCFPADLPAHRHIKILLSRLEAAEKKVEYLEEIHKGYQDELGRLNDKLEAAEERVDDFEKRTFPSSKLKYCKEHKTICMEFNGKLACCLEASLKDAKRRMEDLEGAKKTWLEKMIDEQKGTPLFEAETKIIELEEKLKELEDYYNCVISEPCPTDEKHCTCVPALRHRIGELEASLKKLREAVYAHEYDMRLSHNWFRVSEEHLWAVNRTLDETKEVK